MAKGSASASADYEKAKGELDSIKLPIGWTAGWTALGGESPRASREWFSTWFAQIFGWLLTAFAATLGAPFWFDVLNKVMVSRSTVKPREKSQEEVSEARQPPATQAANAGQGANSTTGLASSLPPTTGAPFTPDENKLDGCDVATTDITLDENLPAAEGGVA